MFEFKFTILVFQLPQANYLLESSSDVNLWMLLMLVVWRLSKDFC